MSELLTAQQVARQWQCTPEHVQRLAKRGLLAGIRLAGRPWRFTPEAVSAFLAAHTTSAASDQPISVATSPAPLRLVELDGALPDRWWENTAAAAASPAAGRARSAGTKKRASVAADAR